MIGTKIKGNNAQSIFRYNACKDFDESTFFRQGQKFRYSNLNPIIQHPLRNAAVVHNTSNMKGVWVE